MPNNVRRCGIACSALIALIILAFLTADISAADPWSFRGPEGAEVNAIVFDPKQPSTVYVGTVGGVWKSTDVGASWQLRSKYLSSYGVNDLAIDGSTTGTVYAAADEGVFKTTDGGATWMSSESGITLMGTRLLIRRNNPAVVYAGTYMGLFKSTNSGSNWENANAGLDLGTIWGLDEDPNQPDVMYAGGYNGLWKTTNGGQSWASVNLGVSSYVTGLVAVSSGEVVVSTWGAGIRRTTDGGQSWSAFPLPDGVQAIYTVRRDPSSAGSLIAGADQPLRSTDGGKTWLAFASPLPDSSCRAVAVSPQDSNTVFAGTDSTLFRSSNGGQNWTKAQTGLYSPRVDAIVFHTARPGWVYAGLGMGGMLRSTDYGQTWVKIEGAIESQPILSILSVPSSQVLYATSANNAIWKSTDNGVNWGKIASEIAYSLISPANNPNDVYGCGWGGKVIRTTDGGQTWTPLNIPTTLTVFALAAHPSNPAVLYAAAEDSVYRTTDGGLKWTKLTQTSIVQCRIVALNPQNPDIIYAGSWSGLYMSTDAGATWFRRNPGFRYAAVERITTTPTAIYAANGYGGLSESRDGEAWSDVYADLPVYTLIRAIAVDATNSRLLLGTTGNGIVSVDLAPKSTVYFPQFADGTAGNVKIQTTFNLVNNSDQATDATLAFFDSSGNATTVSLNSGPAATVHHFTLARGRSISLSTGGQGAALKAGYARLQAGTNVGGTAVFTYTENGTALYEVGVPATGGLRDFTLYVNGKGSRKTALAMVNVGDAVPNATLRLYSKSAKLLRTKGLSQVAANFGPGRHVAKYVQEIFPEEIGNSEAEEGSITVESDQPLAAVTLRQDDDPSVPFPQEVTSMSVLPVTPGRADRLHTYFGSHRGFLSQIADGRSGAIAVKTTILLVNTNFQNTVDISLYSSSGQPMSLSFGPEGTGSSFSRVLKAGEVVSLETPGTGDLQVGYARIQTTNDIGTAAIYSYYASGIKLFDTGVPISLGGTRFTIFVDGSDSSRSYGLALANNSSSPAPVTFKLYDTNYSLVASAALPAPLPASGHTAFFVSDLFPQIQSQKLAAGIVTIESPNFISAVTLRQHAAAGKIYPQDVYLLTLFPVLAGIP